MAPGPKLGAATPVASGGSGGAPATPAAEDEQDEDDAEDTGSEPESAADEPAESDIPALVTAMERKAVNDAVAYIRSLAELRGRNADWAEQAVRLAESLSSQQALEANVNDLVAVDLADLLQQLDGLELGIDGQDVTLAPAGLSFARI